MTDEEFDQFCEDAKKMPGNGIRDSRQAAKEAEWQAREDEEKLYDMP